MDSSRSALHPDHDADGFSAIWPDVSSRLGRQLAARRVPADLIDDLLQETALRLLRIWDRVDPATVWALGQTIASNLIKDEMRRSARHPETPFDTELGHTGNLDDEMVVRIELGRVQKALRRLSPGDRDVLLAEWGERPAPTAVSVAAEKMARMRARKRLRAALERLAAVVPATFRGRGDDLASNPTFGALAQSLSQVAVAAVFGVAAVSSPSPASTPPSAATSAAAFGRTAPGHAALGAGYRHGLAPDVRAKGGPSVADVSNASQRGAGPAPYAGGGGGGGGDNENFGPVRNGDDGVHVGEPGNGLGPYGVDKAAGMSAGGHDAAASAGARYEAPECDGDIVIGGESTYECDGAGHASAHADAEHDGQSHHVGTGDPAP